jgi:carbon storage regulator
MLVLSRKEGEKLIIGDNITLVVSKISGNRVTIGVEAPPEVKIFRGELAERDAEQDKACVVPMRRSATVTIDLEQLNGLVEKHAM